MGRSDYVRVSCSAKEATMLVEFERDEETGETSLSPTCGTDAVGVLARWVSGSGL
jgi:hypothetical protein